MLDSVGRTAHAVQRVVEGGRVTGARNAGSEYTLEGTIGDERLEVNDAPIETEAAVLDATQDRVEDFERLYRESRVRIYNLAARVLGDPDDAADVTQDVFLRVFEHSLPNCASGSTDAWLYRVAVNACYDHLRRRRRRMTTPLDHAGELRACGDDYTRAELTRAVEDALGAMNVRYRTALVLRDLHGLETDEIAAAMRVSPGTARVIVHRARRVFRRSMRDTVPVGCGLSAGGLAAYLPTLSLPEVLATAPTGSALAGTAPAAVSSLPVAGVLVKLGGLLGAKGVGVAAAAAVVAAAGVGLAAAPASVPTTPLSALTIASPANESTSATLLSPSPGREVGSRMGLGFGVRARDRVSGSANACDEAGPGAASERGRDETAVKGNASRATGGGAATSGDTQATVKRTASSVGTEAGEGGATRTTEAPAGGAKERRW